MATLQDRLVLRAMAARKREQAKRCRDLLIDLDNLQAIAILSKYAKELEEAAEALEERAGLLARDVA
jgi:hypothetical protein